MVEDLARLAPELAVLVIVLGFLLKLLQLAKQIFDDLGSNIRNNTSATEHNTQLVKETVEYLKHRNGTFEALIKDAPTLRELAKKAHKIKE